MRCACQASLARAVLRLTLREAPRPFSYSPFYSSSSYSSSSYPPTTFSPLISVLDSQPPRATPSRRASHTQAASRATTENAPTAPVRPQRAGREEPVAASRNPSPTDSHYKAFRTNRAAEARAGKKWAGPRPRPEWLIQKEALKAKFPEGWKPLKKLSPDAMDGIRTLHAQFPQRFPTPVLARRFEVSPEAIRRILKSKWDPSREEDEKRHGRWIKRGVSVWERLSALGVKPPRQWRETMAEARRGRGEPVYDEVYDDDGDADDAGEREGGGDEDGWRNRQPPGRPGPFQRWIETEHKIERMRRTEKRAEREARMGVAERVGRNLM